MENKEYKMPEWFKVLLELKEKSKEGKNEE